MPAKSVKQRRFIAICEHHPEKAKGECPDMSRKKMHDFASTKEKGLREKVKDNARRKR